VITQFKRKIGVREGKLRGKGKNDKKTRFESPRRGGVKALRIIP